MRAFVNLKLDLNSVLVNAVVSEISCYTGLHYNSTQMYYSRMVKKICHLSLWYDETWYKFTEWWCQSNLKQDAKIILFLATMNKKHCCWWQQSWDRQENVPFFLISRMNVSCNLNHDTYKWHVLLCWSIASIMEGPSNKLQSGAVIMLSIFSRILTKDAP